MNYRSRNFSSFILLSLLLVLGGCATSRYHLSQDVGPSVDFDASKVPDAVPMAEPLSRSGNKSPYEVNGKVYRVMEDASQYRVEGIASWYGLKFHGHRTSNGEVYNMYAMSAAHKTLPLPSYVRVTNLDNQRSVIVRVNDRGPFHSGRVIDLSYAAAKKLGYADRGTARVRLEVVTPASAKSNQTSATAVPDKLARFVQVGAYATKDAADRMKYQVDRVTMRDVFVASSRNEKRQVHRVRVGPFYDDEKAAFTLNVIKQAGLGHPQLITRALSARDL